MQTAKIGRVCQQLHHIRGDDIFISCPKKSSAKSVTGNYEPEPYYGFSGLCRTSCGLPSWALLFALARPQSSQLLICTNMTKPEYYIGVDGFPYNQEGIVMSSKYYKIALREAIV